ncbi:MAG: hypothetical protein E2O80_06260 [Betaproteobacteria bacterium]|nr:MAG: hypothetical protein E2O86_04020 [Bacteroidota bacterium]TDI80616.1 MAG: hypothetical protein E2O80_06260 [Betaproteobacteria bacterium]
MNKYVTLVFKIDTPESLKAMRGAAQSDYCRAWSLDHEIFRLELIEQALDENDIEKAKGYFGGFKVLQNSWID